MTNDNRPTPGASTLDAGAALHCKRAGMGLESCAGDCAVSGTCGATGDAGSGDARQGHLYEWRGHTVLAVSSGSLPRVAYIDTAWQWFAPPFHVSASELAPLPMKYFHGEVPK